MALLDKHVNHIIVHTGQNYDYELNEIFWEELELRKPDHFLNIDKTSLGGAVGDIIRKSEEVLKLEKPDAVLVLGDTNSCLAAYMAKRMHIPIFHMEAGNRSFDENVPEETNRRIIDHIADFNLVYTEHARRHLLSEGLPHRRIYLTGSPMKEVLDYYKPKIDASDVLVRLNRQLEEEVTQSNTVLGTVSHSETNNKEKITLSNTVQNTEQHCDPKNNITLRDTVPNTVKLCDTNSYFLVSVHREENVDNPSNLNKILTILNTLAEKYQLPIIVSTHPRTRKRLESFHSSPLTPHASSLTPHSSPLIHYLKPFGFPDYIHLQQHARCVISDSGTISEESAILSFPAISLRNSMERPEAQDAGTIILTGFDPERVLPAIEAAVSSLLEGAYNDIPADYSINDTSKRVLKLIMGNAGLSNGWNGVNQP